MRVTQHINKPVSSPLLVYKTARRIFSFMLLILLQSFQADKDALMWSENRPLTWDDFKGKPEKRFAVASTHYNILKKIKKESEGAVVSIEAVFYRYSSWKKTNWISEQILQHEQKHFDIVELFSRKLRRLISETKYKDYNDLKEQVNKLYSKIDIEMDKYQDLYDEETDASMNGAKQKEWNKKISGELDELKAYANSRIKINLP